MLANTLFNMFSFERKTGTRTRDPDLGKVLLYQLSYFRVCKAFLSFAMQKVGTIF